MAADAAGPSGRGYRAQRCPGCRQLPEHCICALLKCHALRTRVVVVMHHAEYAKPTNTGWLVEPLLEGAEVRLRGLRDKPLREDDLDPERCALLYPGSASAVLGEAPLPTGWPSTLVVPDGTWTQTQRMVRRSAALAALPRLSLSPDLLAGERPRYTLRRGVQPGRCCTLEAVAHALGVLEGPALRAGLLGVLEAHVRAGELRRGLRRRDGTPARTRATSSRAEDDLGASD